MRFFLRSIVRLVMTVVTAPFALIGAIIAGVFSAVLSLGRTLAALVAQMVVGGLAVLVPLAIAAVVVFGIFYLFAQALDGLW